MPDPLIRAIDVRKSFGGLEVLRGITLEVHRGEVLCLLGPSGSGKSTFLRCINHLEAPTSGAISIDGECVGYEQVGHRLRERRPRDIAAARATVGMVFQQFNLFPHMTAIENVMEGPVHVLGTSTATARAQATELLTRVGLLSKANMRPSALSGGEQQRVAIARALAMNPRVLLFDEPTSSLDPELVRDVLEVMRDLASSGITMIVVTHELDFARSVADRVVFMADGVIVEQGPPAEVLMNPSHPRTVAFIRQLASAEN